MDEVISPSDAEQSAWVSGLDAGRSQVNSTDAVRWKKLASYLIGDRTDLDDAILLCTTVDELAVVMDGDDGVS